MIEDMSDKSVELISVPDSEISEIGKEIKQKILQEFAGELEGAKTYLEDFTGDKLLEVVNEKKEFDFSFMIALTVAALIKTKTEGKQNAVIVSNKDSKMAVLVILAEELVKQNMAESEVFKKLNLSPQLIDKWVFIQTPGNR